MKSLLQDLKYDFRTVILPHVGQFIAAVKLVLLPLTLVFGKGMLQKPVIRSPEEVVSILGRMAKQRCSEIEWKDFVSRPIEDVQLDEIRIRSYDLTIQFKRHGYPDQISAEVLESLQSLINETSAA
jgi:hypothetical protein